MKKIFAVLLVCAMLFALPAMATAVSVFPEVATAVDLSGMSFDELLVLKVEIDKALVKCEEWQEVEVPVGVYTVGEDIPEGHWNISAAPMDWPKVTWAKRLDATGKSADYSDILHRANLMGKEHRSYDSYGSEYPPQIDYELKEGQFIIIEDGKVVFTPYTGKPSLGFK